MRRHLNNLSLFATTFAISLPHNLLYGALAVENTYKPIFSPSYLDNVSAIAVVSRGKLNLLSSELSNFKQCHVFLTSQTQRPFFAKSSS